MIEYDNFDQAIINYVKMKYGLLIGLRSAERIKMVKERICKPLNLDNLQTEKVSSAFNDFFEEMDQLVDKNTKPPVRSEKSKVDSFAKIRDENVKLIIPESQFPKYLELELAGRPKGPEDGGSHPN